MEHAPGTAFRIVPDDLAREDSQGDMIAAILLANVQVIPAQVVKASMQGMSFGLMTADEARELAGLPPSSGKVTLGSDGSGTVTLRNGNTFKIVSDSLSITLD